MSRDNTTERNISSQDELSTRNTTNTQTFLETYVLDSDHKKLEEHLMSSQVQQSDLDRCLLQGIQMVQRKEKELLPMAPALTLLLQYGAKWDSDVLLDEQKTPYHIICESPGDHHELLDLMIKSSPKTIIDARDNNRHTALLYAVQNENINCLKCLIADGADLSKGDDSFHVSVRSAPPQEFSAIMQVLRYARSAMKLSPVHKDMFEVLLSKSPIESYLSLITFAIAYKSVYCTKKLIEKGACLDIIDHQDYCVWARIASLGNVELLKCMFNHGIDNGITDQNGVCLMLYVVDSGNVEAVRYLLDLGVTIPTNTPELLETECDQCGEKTLIVDDMIWTDPIYKIPCMSAIRTNNLEMITLLDEQGSQSCKSFKALRHALIYGSVDVAPYLLNNYKYPLNIEYTKESDQSGSVYTLLTEPRLKPRCKSTAKITKLLLDHGADSAKQMCSVTSVNAVMLATADGNLEVIALYIRSGVDINVRSYDRSYGKVLPFEASVLRDYHDLAEMFLISGSSCGVFNLDINHKFKNNLKPKVEKLMKKWEVQENKITSLKLRCRNVMLNHLSPRADVKIGKLPLPRLLIKFLNIPEIDEIVDTQK